VITAEYTAENWPIAAAMLPFGSVDSRGRPIQDAEPEEWAKHLNLVARLGFTEVDPTGSSTTAYATDWFELTNESPVAVSLKGWKMDDSSNAFGTAVALRGIESLAAGESVLFVETPVGKTPQEEGEVVTKFETSWFGSSVPAGLQVGTYNGSGVGLSSSGDGVNVFDSEGDRITGVSFGAASGAIEAFNINLLQFKGSLFATRPTLNHYAAKREDLLKLADETFAVIGSGKVKIPINQTYPLKEAAKAHRDLESRATTGASILLT